MSDSHPSAEELARYAGGGMPRGEGRALERHLAGCSDCQLRVDALPPSGGRTVRWQAHRFAAPADSPENRRAGAGEPAGEVAEALVDEERGKRLLAAFGSVVGALQLRRVDDLLAEPQHRRRQLLRDESDRYGGLNLCELLEERCRAEWRSDPAEAVELAKLAVLVAGEVDPELYGSAAVSNARELALLHLGVSFRIASLTGAEEPADGAPPAPAAATVAEVEAAFTEVRAAFLERRMWFDVAQAALDHVRMLFDLGRPEDAAALGDRASAELREAGAPDQAEEPVRDAGERSRQGRLDEEGLDRLDRIVQEYRNDPRMRFEPEG